jgi:hypothetical protein
MEYRVEFGGRMVDESLLFASESLFVVAVGFDSYAQEDAAAERSEGSPPEGWVQFLQDSLAGCWQEAGDN